MEQYTYKNMEWSNKTLTTAKKYNVDPREVIFSKLLAVGADRAEAYYCLYIRNFSKTMSYEQANTKAAELLENNPGIKILIQKLKNSKQHVNSVSDTDIKAQLDNLKESKNEELGDEVKKFTDKSYIIRELVQAARNATGKERAQILMNIADLQRMKQEETKAEDERRMFYLPYVSHCRTCKIMQLFREFQENELE